MTSILRISKFIFYQHINDLIQILSTINNKFESNYSDIDMFKIILNND